MQPTSRRTVVALGGNAITVEGEEGNIPQQFEHTRRTAGVLADAICQGHELVITHGNGPQVGNILRRVEIAQGELYPIPLEVCVADTQAGMGYMIGQCLMNELRRRGTPRLVTTVVTTIVVEADDPAFQHPSKPIGPRMLVADAQAHVARDGWHVREVAGHYFRRVVPSPTPREILELATIRQLVERGELVICCGGGGIPVVRNAEGDYQGAAAVIDKDGSSALLASQLGCDRLVMLTSVSHAYLDFETDGQRPLHTVTADEARRHLDAGQFAAGSMRPKMEAAVQFVSQSPAADPVAVIAHLDDLVAAIGGRSGTRLVRGAE